MLILAAQEIGWPQGEKKSQKWEEFIKSNKDDNDLPYHSSMLNAKIYLKRFKEIVNALRFIIIKPNPIEMPLPIIPKIKPKMIVKLNVMVIRAIQRWGYPRKVYEILSIILKQEKIDINNGKVATGKGEEVKELIDEDKLVDRSSYLLTWDTFASHCNTKDEKSENVLESDVSVSKIKEIVTAMTNTKNIGCVSTSNTVSDNTALRQSLGSELTAGGVGQKDGELRGETGGGEAVKEGLLADLNVRVIEQTIEKSEYLHRLRMTLACHTEAEMLLCFKVMPISCKLRFG